jgi:hypothetical protein
MGMMAKSATWTPQGDYINPQPGAKDLPQAGDRRGGRLSLGGGCEMAMSCDMIFVPTAKLPPSRQAGTMPRRSPLPRYARPTMNLCLIAA